MKKMTCSRCWGTKPSTDFKVEINGKRITHDFCKSCRSDISHWRKEEAFFNIVSLYDLPKRRIPKNKSSK